MYDPYLDALPPPSQFRRPWSPDPYDPLPSTINGREAFSQETYSQEEYPRLPHRAQRRETSEVSVDALDLADYARTLRARQTEDPYPPFNRPQHPPPSPFPSLPSTHYTPRTARSPPSSLVSRPTLTSTTTHSTTRNPLRRPLSLPPTPHTSAVNIVDPSLQHTEIDITQFPAWSRSWYQPPFNPNHDLDQDIYTPIPTSHLNSTRNKHKSPFDPGYVPDHYGWDPQPPHSSSYDHYSRDFVPWGSDPPEYNNPSMNPALKGERMRMLEREFGEVAKSKSRGSGSDFLDDDGKPLVGTVNDKGQLVTQGPKKRVALRVLQVLLAGTAAVPSIYSAIVIKQPPPGDPPPPANKSAAFILYILSVVTFLLLLYLFVFRPCCCSPRRRSGKDLHNPLLGNGMMVLPMHGGGGKKKGGGKGGKWGKSAKGGKHSPQGGGDVQVNLIVDPHAFGLGNDEEDGEELSDDGGMPGGFPDEQHRRHHKAKGRQQRRRGLLAGLAMEEDWRIARAWAKKLALVDVVGFFMWGTAFVFILLGKRCPSGQFSGWCNAYNVSSAAACLLCIAFGINVFFDIKDLHASKLSPRTR